MTAPVRIRSMVLPFDFRSLWVLARPGRPAAAVRRLRPSASLVDPLDEMLPAELGQYRFTGNDRLAEKHIRIGPVGKVDIDSAAEADQTDPLTRGNDVARLDEWHYPSRYQPGHLCAADRLAIRSLDQDVLPFVLLPGLVEIRAEELARNVDYASDGPAHGRAVDMDVENGHENRDACDRLGTEPGLAACVRSLQLQGRRYLADQRHQSVGGRYNQLVSLGNHPFGITKKGEHPGRKQQQRPADDFPVEEKQHCQSYAGCNQAELSPFGMDRGPAPFGFPTAPVVTQF